MQHTAALRFYGYFREDKKGEIKKKIIDFFLIFSFFFLLFFVVLSALYIIFFLIWHTAKHTDVRECKY